MKNKSTYNNKESKELGYQIPDNYFENFERTLFDRIQSEENIEKHSKELGFNVPEGYFEDSQERIIAKTTENKGRVIYLTKSRLLTAISIAASFVLLFTIYNYIDWNSNLSSVNIVLTDEQINEDALLNAILVEDSKLVDYVDSYVINDLLIQDILTNFIDLDDTTLSLLFEKDSTIDTFLDEYVEDLILEEIQLN